MTAGGMVERAAEGVEVQRDARAGMALPVRTVRVAAVAGSDRCGAGDRRRALLAGHLAAGSFIEFDLVQAFND
jgi:hypothetical protein